MDLVDFVSDPFLPPLARFALGMTILIGVPRLCRRVHFPAAVGLLLSGVAVGPHGLGFFGENRPVADFFGELGKLLLMFFAGLEIDLSLLSRARSRAIVFGIATTAAPLALGIVVGRLFGYDLLSSTVLGSLLASHTMLGAPIVARLGARHLEPMIVTTGATVLSDTLSLLVFAVAISTFKTGFSFGTLAIRIVEIGVLVALILVGLSRAGAYLFEKLRGEDDAELVLMLGMMAFAGVASAVIQVPEIVGAFLAGLAVNTATRDREAKAKLEFLGNALFVPAFFVVTGFLIDPVAFGESITEHSALVATIVMALAIGKGVAADAVGRAFGYDGDTRATMWSLTLPQVAATLAATLVALHTLGPTGERPIDRRLADAIFVLVVTTSIAGPVLTARFAPLMLARSRSREL